MTQVPIVDDGWLPPMSLRLCLDLYDFRPAPASTILGVYRERLAPLLGLYRGYVPNRLATGYNPDDGTQGGVVAIQLKNGLYIRASPPEEGVDLKPYGLQKPIQVSEFEWTVSRDLTELDKPCSTSVPGGEPMEDMKRMEELYKQYRYIVSNWIGSDDAEEGVGGRGRKTMESILFSKLPVYEKRKRMEIHFGTLFRSWMAPDPSVWDLPVGFLRKDCRVMDEGECTGTCVWKAEEEVCALHVDAMTALGSRGAKGRSVSTPTLFARRIMDELIRFPKRRRELMAQEVSQLSGIQSAVRIGEDQFLIPEKGSTWIDFLRMDWRLKGKSRPQFYEEMARSASAS